MAKAKRKTSYFKEIAKFIFVVCFSSRLAAEEQTLSNLIRDKKWGKALGIAIRLNKPFRALKIIKEILDSDPEELRNVLEKFRHDQIISILEFAVQWNTKTKNSREAQVINIFIIKRCLFGLSYGTYLPHHGKSQSS